MTTRSTVKKKTVIGRWQARTAKVITVRLKLTSTIGVGIAQELARRAIPARFQPLVVETPIHVDHFRKVRMCASTMQSASVDK